MTQAGPGNGAGGSLGALSLAGRVALVTGGSRGIGAAAARLLAERGAAVAVNYREREDAARKLCAEILAGGGRALAVGFDVSDAGAAARGVAQVVEALGGLHILVNNAGISIDGLLLRMSEDDWDRVIDTNLKGTFLCCKAAVRHVIKARELGRIINLTSVVGEQGNPGQAAYAASKAGIVGLTKSLARELAPRGVTVNAVAPGFIDTDMSAAALGDAARVDLLGRIPLGRVGLPEEVAEAVAFLASAAAAFITGHVLRVNGGLHT